MLALVALALSGCKSTPADVSQALPEREVVTDSSSSVDARPGPPISRTELPRLVAGTPDGSVLVLSDLTDTQEFSWFDVRTGQVVASAKTERSALHFVIASADVQQLVLATPLGEDYRDRPRFAVEVVERRTGETRRVREFDGFPQSPGVLDGSSGTLVMLLLTRCGETLQLLALDGSEPKTLVIDPDEPRSNSQDCVYGASRRLVGGPDWLATLVDETEIEIRDPRSGEVIRTLPSKREREQLQAIDAGRVLLAKSGGSIQAWDITTGSELWTLRIQDLLPNNANFRFAAVDAEQIAVLHNAKLTAVSRTNGPGTSQAVSGSGATLYRLPQAIVVQTDAMIRVYDPSLTLVASIVGDADGRPVLER